MARTPKVRSSDPSIILYEAGEPQEVLPVQTSMQQLTRWRFTVHDYHRMGETGILHEDDRVELIEGELVEMTAIGTRHFSCVNRLNRLLVMNVGDEAIISVQNPVRLNEYNEPQPDLAVIRPRLRPRGKAAALRAGWDQGGLDRRPCRGDYRSSHRPVRGRLPSRRPAASRTGAGVHFATRPDPERGRSPRLIQAEASTARPRTASPSSSSSSVMTKGMRVRMQLPYWPALRSRSPSSRAAPITFAVRSLSGVRLSASLTNSIAAIGPLPRTSPTKSGCRSWISRIAAMTRSPTKLARVRRSSSSKASSTARAAAQAIGLPP